MCLETILHLLKIKYTSSYQDFKELQYVDLQLDLQRITSPRALFIHLDKRLSREHCLDYTHSYFFKTWSFKKVGSAWPGRKLGNLGNLGCFLPRFLNSSFRFWLSGKIENSEVRKLGIIFLRLPSFRFATFSFFFLNYFFFFINVLSKSLFYICNYSSTLYFVNMVRLSH